jgi:hypothetical protein
MKLRKSCKLPFRVFLVCADEVAVVWWTTVKINKKAQDAWIAANPEDVKRFKKERAADEKIVAEVLKKAAEANASKASTSKAGRPAATKGAPLSKKRPNTSNEVGPSKKKVKA